MRRCWMAGGLMLGMFAAVAHGQQQFSSSQGTFGAQNPGGNISNTDSNARLNGFSQSGQLTGSAANTQASGFVGASTTAGTSSNFLSQSGTTGVGGRSGLGTTGLGSTGLGGFGGGLGFGGGNNMFGQAAMLGLGGGYGNRGGQMGQQNQMNSGAAGQSTIRTSLRAGFSIPREATPVIATRFERRLSNMRQIRSVGPIHVTLLGEKAILEGVVESDHVRELAERVALLEPGISQVQNDLTIGTPPPDPEDFPLLPTR